MKYIIFKWRLLYMPIMFPEHITHSQIKIIGAEAISAGFFRNVNGFPQIYGDSESLKLKPHERDASILYMAMQGDGTSSFLVSNFKQ